MKHPFGTVIVWYLLTLPEGSLTPCYRKGNGSDITVCKSSLSENICLVCPVSRNTTGILWKGKGNKTIFMGGVRVEKLSFNVSVNTCSERNYSLSLHAKDFSVEGTYSCYENEHLNLAQFIIRIQVSPEVILKCIPLLDECDKNIYKGLVLSFHCEVFNARRPLQLIWRVNETTKATSNFGGSSDSSPVIVNESSYFNYTFEGVHVNMMCQINGEYVVQSSNYINFKPEDKAIPILTVILDGKPNVAFFELSRNFTVQMLCSVTSEKLPLTLSWQVDGQEKVSESFQNLHVTPLQIKLHFTPLKEIQNVTCVCKGPRVHKRRHTVTMHLHQKSFSNIIYVISGSVGVSVLCLLLCLCVMRTTTHRAESRESSSLAEEYTIGMAMGLPQEGDIYCMPDACEQLSRYVYLCTRLSGEGRLDRWLGELSGVSYHRKSCVGSTCADSASEGEKEEFRRLAIYIKESVNHDYVTDVIGIEIHDGPTYIFTEFVENGNLESFLINQKLKGGVLSCTEVDLLKFCHDVTSALVYLQTLKLGHPLIRCRKVLLTKWNTCKVYDIQLYPVHLDIITKIVSKQNNSLSIWMAPETKENMLHTYLSDSWSLGVFIWEVYSWGMDPTYSCLPCSTKRHTQLAKPEKCPKYIYSILLSCWEVEETKRPSLEKIQKKLINIEGHSNSETSFFGAIKTKKYENV